MNTFLPYADFALSASVLDRQRLGKQRVECLQILTALKNGGGWSNHPCTKQWKGYETALAWYGLAICNEWKNRGYKDTVAEKIKKFIVDPLIMPPWLGREDFHASHRSNLLRKAPLWYSRYGWKEPNNLPYVWPSKEGKT